MEQQHPIREGLQVPHPDQLIAHIRQRLEDTADTQIQLSSSRKQLLVKRERLRTASRVIQQKRVAAGDAEAAFMSQLRELVNTNSETLSTPLSDAYEKVEQTRNALGETEDNYREAESDLMGAEWTFMDQEDRFYQWDIHSILPEEMADSSTLPYAVMSEKSPHLSTLDPIFHPIRVPSSSQVPELPPPPPPPPPPPERSPISHQLADLTFPTDAEQAYATMMARVNELKREFDQLRQKKASGAQWDDVHASFESDQLLEDSLADSTYRYGDVVLDISIHETIAQQFRAEEMMPELGASALKRRYPNLADSCRPAPIYSDPMQRIQPENTFMSIQDQPNVNRKIQDWSLSHLKESPVHKQLYFNTLQEYGVANSAESDWKARVTQSWDHDNLTKREEGSGTEASTANGTGYELDSCQESCATQNENCPPPVQHNQESRPRHIKHTTSISEPHILNEVLPVCPDTLSTPSTSPIPLPEYETAHDIEIDNRNKTTIPAVYVSTEQQLEADNGMKTNVSSTQESGISSGKVGDTAQRKDSAQPTDVTPHIDCEVANMHGHEVKKCRKGQRKDCAESTTGSTALGERMGQPLQHHEVGLHPTHSFGSSMRGAGHAMSDFDHNARPVWSSHRPLLDTSPAPINETQQRIPEGLVTPHTQPGLQKRRHTIGWIRNLLPRPKGNRSNSTSFIGRYRPLARSGKHSVS
ncbi:hypothetical protein AA0111_g2183 [Alternaria arborescens]|uniref:hypothetical protein n=1 Tax=Alternaria arborescens TaxID=156630 RepID=UPI001075869F|nr:hypothetical protein AA0111_g2183 [Alternaria arborescens]RYO38014.1 hypothetical protein AA0111_g2183 [Alternaria arborescens]